MATVRTTGMGVALALLALACKHPQSHENRPDASQPPLALPQPAGLVFAEPCAAPQVVATGRATDPALTELSGVAASRRLPDVLWVHNDSGNKARVYAISPAGKRLASWKLKKVPSTDWEDIALGACGASGAARAATCLYLADTGDNHNDRAEVHILRWPEPSALPAADADDTLKVKGDVEVFTFTLPDGPQDIEAMVVLPDTRAVLFSKRNDGTSKVFRVTMATPPQVELLGTLDLRDDQADHGEALRVTAADLHPNGKLLALRTYGRVLVSDLGAQLAAPAAIAGAALTHVAWRHWPQPDDPHGEAIAWAQDGGLWLLSDRALPVVWHAQCQAALPSAATPVSR